MNDSVLVEALRARKPGALNALYDSYAEGLYRYCWFMLGGPDGSQVALRDTLIAAEAHIHALADPDRLETWLYALARGECVRRRLAADLDPPAVDVAPAEGDEAGPRTMAWNAVRSLPPEDREVLELTSRHGLTIDDLATVLGVSVKTAGTMYESARERLRDVVAVEVLARKGPRDCASRMRLLGDFPGELPLEKRQRIVRHMSRCGTCAPHRARQVSADKVFDLLPVVVLPETLRVRVMSCFTDPELVPYRRHVARRVGALDAGGFPIERIRGNRRRSCAMAGAMAAVAAVAAIALAVAQFVGGSGETVVAVASETSPATVEPPGVRLPWSPKPGDIPMTLEPLVEGASTHPIGSVGLTEPIAVSEPVPDGHSPRPTGGPRAPTARPTRPSAPHEPSRPEPAPPRPVTPERPGPPHDHQGGRSGSHFCRTTPRPTPPSPAPTRPAPKPTSNPTPKPTPKPTSKPTPSPKPTPPQPTPTAPKPTPTPTPTDKPTASPSESPAPSEPPAATDRPTATPSAPKSAV
ncbi:sigma factor-like helix-turn-helix DNA-binding protein [Streptosporangium sp. NPDC000396]|uniref:RNA polymerase sigma factor n=1 Tax=Streptosporangium sp. NPDC000396 TaxID=3366185 RepID=UPI0036A351E4